MKLLYAINHRETESRITADLGRGYEVVFTATYKEALLNALTEHQTDIIIIRESLKGDISTVKMVEEIRMDYSEARIIYICGKKKRGDKEIAKIVGLGVYDIISKDSVPTSEIISCVKNKRMFRDVAMYYLEDYIPDIEEVPDPEPVAPQKKGIMARFQGKKGGAIPTEESSSVVNAPQVNADLLRKTLKEEATREAQRDLDSLLEKAVISEMSKANDEIERLKKETEEAVGKLAQKETRINNLNKQLNEEKNRYESLREELEEHLKEAKEGYQVYEEQLSALQKDVDTPAFYTQQAEKFATREQELLAEITRLKTISARLEKEKERLEQEEANLTSKLEERTAESGETTQALEREVDHLRRQLNRTQESSFQVESEAIDSLKAELAYAKMQLEQAKEASVISSGSSTELLELQRELEIAQQQLAHALENPKGEPEIKYVEKIVEKIVEKKVPVPGIPDSTMDGVVKDLRRENTELSGKVTKLQVELKEAKDNPPISSMDGLDFSTPSTYIPLIPDESSYVKSTSPVRVIAMVGAKHGVGNTTVAMNLAALLGKQGKKTLLMEFNNRFPMTNEFFELMNVPLGIPDALASVSTNPSIADAAIIRFHALTSANKNLVKAYKKLPAGFHLMTYPNKDLVSTNKSYPTKDGIFYLLQYLLNKQHYSHIILDIQPDEMYILDVLIESGIDVDKLILTTSQDPHGISTAGKFNSFLMGKGATALLGESDLVITKYSRGYLTDTKIAKHLHYTTKHVTTLSDDTEGYINATSVALPYVLTKGHYKDEYDMLYSKII